MCVTKEQIEEIVEERLITRENRFFRWILAIVMGGVITLITGAVSWGALNSDVSHLEKQMTTDRITLTERLNRIESKLDRLIESNN